MKTKTLFMLLFLIFICSQNVYSQKLSGTILIPYAKNKTQKVLSFKYISYAQQNPYKGFVSETFPINYEDFWSLEIENKKGVSSTHRVPVKDIRRLDFFDGHKFKTHPNGYLIAHDIFRLTMKDKREFIAHPSFLSFVTIGYYYPDELFGTPKFDDHSLGNLSIIFDDLDKEIEPDKETEEKNLETEKIKEEVKKKEAERERKIKHAKEERERYLKKAQDMYSKCAQLRRSFTGLSTEHERKVRECIMKARSQERKCRGY